MKIVVGLGNPGEKYEKHRHNVGFLVLDSLARAQGLDWKLEKKFNAYIAKHDNTLLVKPQTFMNNSGESVSAILNFYKVDAEDLTVVHDDLDLPLFEVKRQFGVGAAGHHGIESIIGRLSTKEFWRVRVGIGRPVNGQSPEDFVLSNFSGEELEEVSTLSVNSL